MRNRWLLIVGASVVLGLLLSLILKPHSSGGQTYLAVDQSRRVAVELPAVIGFEKLPLEQRIFGTPNELVNFLYGVNIVNGVKGVPLALALPAPPAALQAVLAALPAAIREKLSGKLIGIYLTSGLDTGGITKLAYRELDSVQPFGAIVALDLRNFQTGPHRPLSLDQWMALRESSAFVPLKPFAIEARLLEDSSGFDAMEYTLLRELGQILALNSGVYPAAQQEAFPDGAEHKYPFLELSWQFKNGGLQPRPEFDFKGRQELSYGGKPKVKASQLREVYERLEQTNFPTLLAAQGPFDDFAESFASYVHTQLLHQPFELRLLNAGKVVKTIHSCWDEPRCAKKREFFERFLAN